MVVLLRIKTVTIKYMSPIRWDHGPLNSWTNNDAGSMKVDHYSFYKSSPILGCKFSGSNDIILTSEATTPMQDSRCSSKKTLLRQTHSFRLCVQMICYSWSNNIKCAQFRGSALVFRSSIKHLTKFEVLRTAPTRSRCGYGNSSGHHRPHLCGCT